MQYKSSTHFWLIQELANKYAVPIICFFSIVQHGKGKVDHVGGLAKTIIQSAIVKMQLARFIFLNKTTKAKQTQHVLKEIDSKELWLLRTEAKLKVFKTVLDSNLFQVMVFHLFSSIIKASP